MIDPGYVQRMARYNRWQNQNLYGVADSLSDEERRGERGQPPHSEGFTVNAFGIAVPVDVDAKFGQ